MRHRMKNRKFKINRQRDRMMFRNLSSSLILHERIVTTLPKAKELSREIDGVLNVAKQGTLDSKRRLVSYLNEPTAYKKLVKVLAPKYSDRNSGYTRIVKMGPRKGDAAPKVTIEFV